MVNIVGLKTSIYEMKIKTAQKVIADLRELFEISKTGDKTKDSLEITGTFFIYKRHIKRKKAKKIFADYFKKVKIENGHVEKQKKSIAYSFIFKIVSNEVSGKKEKEKEEKGQRTKKTKNKKSKKSN